jgi:putative peptidoglycan lipid II flippase
LTDLIQKITSLFKNQLQRGLSSRMVSGFLLVAVLTFGSKALSFVKDAVVARQFGTGDSLDAFMFSFGLLTFIAALIGGGIPESFLPMYAEMSYQKSELRAQRLGVQSCLVHAAVLLFIGAVIYLLAPYYVVWIATGFSAEKQQIAVDLMRQLLPFMLCFGMSFQLSSWLRADKFFTVATAAPVLVPLVILIFFFKDGAEADLHTLLYGSLLGAFLHMLVLLIVIWRGFRPSVSFLWDCLFLWEAEMRQVTKNAVPFVFAGAIFTSVVVVDQTMAAWLEPGSVAVLGYTDKVCGIILALTASPACDVLFPYFADKVARRDWRGVRRQLFHSAGVILSLALPAALLLCWLAPWVIEVLFQRGTFSEADTERVAHVLRFASLQIPFYILGGLASRVVVALQATRFILVLSAVGLIANASLNWVLMQTMGAAGIALSSVLVQMLAAAMACLYVLRQIQGNITAEASG